MVDQYRKLFSQKHIQSRSAMGESIFLSIYCHIRIFILPQWNAILSST